MRIALCTKPISQEERHFLDRYGVEKEREMSFRNKWVRARGEFEGESRQKMLNKNM